MEKYWLYLEPYTFIFSSSENTLIYNSLSFKNKSFKNSDNLREVLSQLKESRNMYNVFLTEESIKVKEIAEFICFIQKSYSGDILRASNNMRPVIFPPILKHPNSIDKIATGNHRALSLEIPFLLKEVFLYVGGTNPSSNLNPAQVVKQFDYCIETNNNSLSFPYIKKLISTLGKMHLQCLNILGGNVFTYPDYDKLLKELSQQSFITRIYATYIDVPEDSDKFSSFKKQDIIRILIDFPIDYKVLDRTIHLLKTNNQNIEFLIAITSLDEFEKALTIKEKYRLNKCEIKPVFSGGNFDFFKEYVFLSEKDTIRTRLSRKKIFLNQTLNTFYFGKLRVLPDGKVYSDLNKPFIGDINVPIIEMLYYEMSKRLSWFNIRDQEPCNNCIYQWLCPPPSGYEQVMGKPNLCTIK